MIIHETDCKLTFIKFLSLILLTSFKFLTILSCLSPSQHCNLISIYGHYLYVNHSQHDFHKPLSQVLPQRTSLKFLSEIHFKAVLEGVDFKIFSFFSFLGKLFIIAEIVPPLEFLLSYSPALICIYMRFPMNTYLDKRTSRRK